MLQYFSNVLYGTTDSSSSNSEISKVVVDPQSFEESRIYDISTTTSARSPPKLVQKKIKSEDNNVDLSNSAFRRALQAIEDSPNIRDPKCVNMLCSIDDIQLLNDGHFEWLRNKICSKVSRLDCRIWSGNGMNKTNEIVSSWRGACSNRGATNKSSYVIKNKVDNSKCYCKAKFILKRTGAIIFSNDHEYSCKQITYEELDSNSMTFRYNGSPTQKQKLILHGSACRRFSNWLRIFEKSRIFPKIEFGSH